MPYTFPDASYRQVLILNYSDKKESVQFSYLLPEDKEKKAEIANSLDIIYLWYLDDIFLMAHDMIRYLDYDLKRADFINEYGKVSPARMGFSHDASHDNIIGFYAEGLCLANITDVTHTENGDIKIKDLGEGEELPQRRILDDILDKDKEIITKFQAMPSGGFEWPLLSIGRAAYFPEAL